MKSAVKKDVFVRRQSQLIHYKEFLNRQLGKRNLDTPHVASSVSRNNTSVGLSKASKRGEVSQDSYQQQDMMIITGHS